MKENEQHLKQTLRVLAEENVLQNVVIIGSWCLLFYKHVFDDFSPLIMTFDIDFFVPNPKSIKEKTGLIKSLKEINFDVIRDTLTNKSIFISPEGFELEFLTKVNRDQLTCVKLGNTGIYAETLSYVDYFYSDYIVVEYDDLKVNVASPASYVLQKLLINKDRKDKREKDIESIRHVLEYIKASKKYYTEMRNLYNSLPRKWKNTIDKTALENKIELFIS